MTKWSQDYGVKSNARRAARAAGVDADQVVACKGNTAWHFPLPEEKGIAIAKVAKAIGSTRGGIVGSAISRRFDSYAKARAAADVQAARSGLKLADFAIAYFYPGNGKTEYAFVPAADADDYNIAKAPVAAPAVAKPAKTSKAKKERAKSGEGQDKLATLLTMITAPRGATMPEITKATGWLPHTARARISGVVKKHKLTIARERLLGVTTYKATFPKKKAA